MTAIDRRVNVVALGVVVQEAHVLLMRMPAWLMPEQPSRAIDGFVEFGELAGMRSA